MIEYDADDIRCVRDRGGNVIGAGSGAQPVSLNRHVQPLQMREAQMNRKRMKKRAETKKTPANHGKAESSPDKSSSNVVLFV